MEGVSNVLFNSGLILSRLWTIGLGMSDLSLSCASDPKKADPSVQAPMFGDYIVAFDSNLTDVVQFTGVAILVLGFSNFIW